MTEFIKIKTKQNNLKEMNANPFGTFINQSVNK